MTDYIVLRRNAWSDELDLERAAGRASRFASELGGGVRWLRSYVFEEPDGTLGSVCIFQAPDRDTLIEHAQRAGLGCDAVLPLTRSVLIEDEP